MERLSSRGHTWTKTRQQLSSPWRHDATHTMMAAGVIVFIATVVQSPARFIYDAAVYWSGAVGLAHGRLLGELDLKGALTSVLYLPAALATRGLGESAGGAAVLVENSLLVSLVGVLLLPQLLRTWVPVTSWMVWVCAGLTWLLVGRFAPYPLVDLWAAALMLAAVVVLQRRTTIGLMGAGLLAGIAFNIRPAYLVPLLLATVVVLFRQRSGGLWFAAGAVVAQVPQSIVNLMLGAGWKPWPSRMPRLSQVQSYYGSYIVRYDTVYLPGRAPQQFFCDPVMAQSVRDHLHVSPGGLVAPSPGDLAASYLHNVPQSLLFAAEKATAALHWPLSTPYFAPTGARDEMFALLVATVTILGIVSLVRAQSKLGFRSASVAVWVAAAVWLGSLATIVTSAPETRFAMPLVLFGIAGFGGLVRGRLGSRWATGVVIAVVVVFAIGTLGLSHPAAPGPARSPSVCLTR